MMSKGRVPESLATLKPKIKIKIIKLKMLKKIVVEKRSGESARHRHRARDKGEKVLN